MPQLPWRSCSIILLVLQLGFFFLRFYLNLFPCSLNSLLHALASVARLFPFFSYGSISNVWKLLSSPSSPPPPQVPPPKLLCSKLNKPSSLNYSSRSLPPTPFVSYIWTLSSFSKFFLICRPQNWTWYSTLSSVKKHNSWIFTSWCSSTLTVYLSWIGYYSQWVHLHEKLCHCSNVLQQCSFSEQKLMPQLCPLSNALPHYSTSLQWLSG